MSAEDALAVAGSVHTIGSSCFRLSADSSGKFSWAATAVPLDARTFGVDLIHTDQGT